MAERKRRKVRVKASVAMYQRCMKSAKEGDEVNMYMRQVFRKYDSEEPPKIEKRDKVKNKGMVRLDNPFVLSQDLEGFMEYAMNAIIHVGMAKEKRRRVTLAGYMVNGVRLVILEYAKVMQVSNASVLEGDPQVSIGLMHDVFHFCKVKIGREEML